MTDSKVGEALGSLLKSLLKFIHQFSKRHTIPLIASVVVVLVAWQSWDAYQEYSTRQITLLTGPWTPEHMDESRRIKNTLESGSTTLADNSYPVSSKRSPSVNLERSYSLKLEQTTGYEENRRRINADDDGRIAAFAYDGFGESDNVSIVLPLDKRYLRILVHTDYLAELARDYKRNPPELKRVFRSLKSGRVYLGPRGSATRMCAEIVLEHFGFNESDMGRLACYGVGSFRQIRPALARGHIDLAFSSGGFDSDTISQIAKDGHCILLGLNEERDAIVQQNPHLVSVDFEKNSYASGDFCPDVKKTIGARRVIVASNKMSAKDAYTLGISAWSALRHEIPEVEWQTPPIGAEKTNATPLRFPRHPGAELIRQHQEPSTPYPWVTVFLASIALWAIAELIRVINAALEKFLASQSASPEHDSPDDTVDTADDDKQVGYQPLRERLDEYVGELERAEVPLAGATFDGWDRKISDLQSSILKASRSGCISQDQADSLLTGLRHELARELEIRSPMFRQHAADVYEATS